MVLNRSRFLSAHCARIISCIIWLDTGPIQRLKTLAVSIFSVSVPRCLILQSPSFFTLHGSEQVKISVRALCAHNLAQNMAGHGPHSATVKLSKGAHVQPMAPWQPLLIRNMEIHAQSIMRGLLGNGTMLQNMMRGLCAPGFYYARHYARVAFIMRDIMRGACNTAIHYARIMRACVLLCAALCATLCADSSHYERNAYSALCPPWLSTPPACPTPVQQPLLCPHTSWHGGASQCYKHQLSQSS